MNERTYFETERQAEDFLSREGFLMTHSTRETRYPYRNGDTGADIRFNSIGIFVEYREGV